MTFIRFSIATVALIALSVQAATAGTVEVFLLGGQSNAVGRDYSSGLPSALQQPQTDVDFYFSSTSNTHPWEDQLIDLKPGASDVNRTDQFGPEITFGRDMADYYASDPDTSVAIIKYAHGGTRLYDHWAAPSGPDYTAFQDTVSAGMAALQSAHPDDTVEIAGMIWMQGENDTTSNIYANSYQNNLGSFIGDVRTRYGADLPFVVGRLSTSQSTLDPTRRQTVMDAQTAVANANSRTRLVDTNPFEVKSNDPVHFSAVGLQSMGSGFASVMQTTINTDPDDPPNPGGDPTVTGAVAHYSFDTDYNDSSVNGYHGVAYDGSGNGNTNGVSITSAAGEFVFGDGAANFTAERDWVQIPEQLFYNGGPHSVSFWARDLSDTATGGMVLGVSGAGDPRWPTSMFFVWLRNEDGDDGDYIRWRGSGQDPIYEYDVNLPLDNDWHHYTYTVGDYDDDGTVDDVTLYRDGTFVGSDPDSYTGFVIDSIGSGYGSNLDFDFEGQIDEVWIFNRALNADEINLLYTTNAQPVGYIPGDANGDGVVDGDDAATLAANWLAGDATWAMGDFNNDGLVNELDATLLAANWQTGSATNASVPEPTCLVLLGLGMLCLGFLRRNSSFPGF